VGEIERGRTSPTVNTYARLATVLGIEPGAALTQSYRRPRTQTTVPVWAAVRPTLDLLKKPEIRWPMRRVRPILYSKSPIFRPASW